MFIFSQIDLKILDTLEEVDGVAIQKPSSCNNGFPPLKTKIFRQQIAVQMTMLCFYRSAAKALQKSIHRHIRNFFHMKTKQQCLVIGRPQEKIAS